MLLAAGAIYLILGDRTEAIVLLSSVLVVITISLFQNRRTERALQALRDLSSPRALVIRDGARRRIPGREVVPGDLLVLSEGDRVPADAGILQESNLAADESLLTGESLPVRKTARGGNASGQPANDDPGSVYSGTLVVSGDAVARVESTGARTAIGRIGRSLESISTGRTRLQREIGRLVNRLAVVGLSLCGAVVVLYGLTRGSWLQGILAGLALAMAVLPEEFPVILTVFFAIGAWRISRRRVLTRRLPAIESLGATTVLCVDKTGTLTQNRMAVQRIYAMGSFHDVPDGAEPLDEPLREVVRLGVLASKPDPFDPMELAIRSLGPRAGPEFPGPPAAAWELARAYPLSPELLVMSHVWNSPADGRRVIAAKGAPEAIAELCRLAPAARDSLRDAVGALAAEGLRVLGVARGTFDRADLPETQDRFDFEFAGLLGLADPIRPEVPAAIRECRQAGIRVVMITGDHPVTAVQIAREIGLARDHAVVVLTGAGLDGLDDDSLRGRIGSVEVFARVRPEQKLRIVRALQANGEVVAMTGDGVNDAPALKASDMGIAMGQRGTDVAREAADLVLLDDDFASIVAAVRSGRRIFDNLRNAATYIFAIHVPIAGMSLLPVLFGWPLVLMPVHIVFLELIIDPACSLVFEAEPEEDDVMKRPPRHPEEPIFSKDIVILGLLQGFAVLAIVLAVFAVAFYRGQGAEDSRALAFTTLIVSNLALILANRSRTRTIVQSLRSRNGALPWVLGGAVVFLILLLSVPAVRHLFAFSKLHLNDLVLCLVAGLFSIAWFEGFKLLRARKSGGPLVAGS